MPYKFLAHTADLKIEAAGTDIEEAFIESAMALKEAICGKIDIKQNVKIRKRIKVSGRDKESLLYIFLEQFLYLLDAEDFLLNKVESIKINKEDNEITANVIGDKASNHKFTNDVKAITYNEMFVGEEVEKDKKDSRNDKDKFICRFVVDV